MKGESLLFSLIEKEKKGEYIRRYRKKHPKRIKESQRRYRERHKEEIKIKCRIWRERNPEKVKEYTRNYYLRHKEQIREYTIKYRKEHPEIVKRMSERNKERYRTDPEYRARIKKAWRIWYKKNRVRILSTKTIQPYTKGLECGFCGFNIKTITSGRFGKKSFVKCPKCKMQQMKGDLKKINIPRDIPVIPTKNPNTSVNHPIPNRPSKLSGKDDRKGV